VASISTDFAHSGSHSAKLSIVTDGSTREAVRIFRWNESKDPRYPDLYYSVWYYIPQLFQVRDWWNVFQWKSKYYSGGVEYTDPIFDLEVGNRSGSGAMYYYLRDEYHNVTYNSPVSADLPVGRWFHVEAYLERAYDNSGHITVWQDGVQIFDEANVQTAIPSDGSGPASELQWSVDNYTHALTPNVCDTYIDDAAIGTRFIP
jgi:hypothetical protein